MQTPTQHGQVDTQLVLHSAALQGKDGEVRWVGLGDAIHQVRECRDVRTVNSRVLAKLQQSAIHMMTHLDQWNSLIPMFPPVCGNTKHKVASNSIGPNECHVTC